MVKKICLIFLFLFNVYSVVAVTNPILSNFRIEDTHKNRVYFDSNIPVPTTLDATGFIISGKTISSLAVNENQTTGHYFTVSSPFTFWDNNTIRLENGGNIVKDFTLTYITNNIAEPDASDDRFVAASASGGGDGLTEATPWTFEEAVRNAQAGQTVWVKAGDYGAIYLEVENSGTEDNPIKFIGYTSVTDDINTLMVNNFVYMSNSQASSFIDSNTYPVLRGNNSHAGFGIITDSKSNIIFRNICVTNNEYGFANYGTSTNIVYDNCLAGNNYRSGTPFGRGWNTTEDTEKIRITNSICFDSSLTNIRLDGSFHLINNTKTASGVFNPGDSGTDYWISTNKFINCIVKDSEARRVGKPGHKGHGIGGKSYRNIIRNSLWVNNYSEDVQEGFFLAYEDTYNCVFKNNTYYGDPTDKVLAGIVVRDGAHDNIFENNFIQHVKTGILQWRTSEQQDQTSIYISLNNTFRNNVIKDYIRGIEYYARNDAPLSAYTLRGIKMYNNTFYENDNGTSNYLFVYNTASLPVSFLENEFKNNIVYTTYRNYLWGANGSHFDEQYNNYFNCGEVPSATGNISTDPLFVNPGNDNFKLQEISPVKDAGTDLNLNYDKDGALRIEGKFSMGAYDDATPLVGSVIEDQSICTGESITLTASGGSTYLWDNGETTESITVTPSETTTYSVTITEGAESQTHDIVVTVYNPPSVIASDDVTICEGESVTLTASGNGEFYWSNGEVGSSITIIPTETTTYTVTASNACSNDATDEVVVTVNPSVNLDAGQDVAICQGETVTLTATGTGPFDWSTGETTASIDVSPNDTTTYTVTSTNGACSETDEVLVTVNLPPTVDGGPDRTICEGESITLNATGNGDFLWSTGETTASITVDPTQTTTYTVIASNACSQDATDEIIVTVNPSVNLNAGSNVTICQGETVTLTATGTGPFLWDTGETTASISVSPNTTTEYTVSSSNGACSETDQVVVTVNQPPSVNAGQNQTICEGESVVLTATGNGNFLWSTGATTASISVSPNSTTTYTVTASNSCTADATDEVTVTVNPNVTLNAGADQSICSGENTVLTATGTGPFLWSTGETTASITVAPQTTTNYTVISDNGNCSKSDQVRVYVNNSPSVNAGPDRVVCAGDNVRLTATGEGDFLWSTGETTSSITVSPTATTVYTVTATSQGCQSTAVDTIEVFVSEQPDLTVSEDVFIQEGEEVTLNASGNGTFEWSTGQTGSSITVSPLASTSYSVTLTTAGGCTEKKTIIVNVNAAVDSGMVTVFAGEDATICSGDRILLSASGGEEYLWDTGETSKSITVAPTESTIYSVRILKEGFEDTAYIKVTVDGTCNTSGEMVVYPNPAKDLVNVDLIGYDNGINIQMYSLNGTLVYSRNLENEQRLVSINHQIDLSRLEQGIYLLSVVSGDRKSVKKIIHI